MSQENKYIEKEALHAMMAVLTKKQRNLIYQNYVLDKTHQEIADGMGIARGSVTRSVNQALERMDKKKQRGKGEKSQCKKTGRQSIRLLVK